MSVDGPVVWMAQAFDEDVRRVVGDRIGATLSCAWGHDATQDLDDVRVLVRGVPTLADLERVPDVELVIVPWAGIHPRVVALLASRPNIVVCNLHHNASATAEMALTLLLSVWKQVVPMDRALRDGDWRPRYAAHVAVGVEGKRVVIAGMGAIGSRVGKALLAMGASVVGVRRGPSTAIDGIDTVTNAQADAALQGADAVVLALPATSQTEGWMGAERLASLAPGAVVVNVARGRVVDEEALYQGLVSGHLGGAGLDVWWNYPDTEESRASTSPSRFPFRELDTVVLSPHRGGHTTVVEAARGHALADILVAWHRGNDLPNRVNLNEGY